MGNPGLPPPRIALGGGEIVFDRPSSFYWLALTYGVAANAIMWRVMRSRIGRAFQAIRQNEPLAQSQGIDPLRYKLLWIDISAYLTGIAGAPLVFHLTIVEGRLHRPLRLRRLGRPESDRRRRSGACRRPRRRPAGRLVPERFRCGLCRARRRHLAPLV